jgi:malonyl-CoA O-methyltransferase
MSDRETASQSDPLALVRAAYDRWSAVYDHDLNPLPALEEPHVRALAGDVRGLSALDLGCGTGRHAAWLAAAGARVTAADFSAGMLREARRKAEAGDVRYLVLDLNEPLPFRSGTFDLVVSGLVLEHLRGLPAFFHECRRVLCESGRAVVSAMHPAMFLRQSRARFTDPESGQIVEPGSIAHQTADAVMAALRAGFSLEYLGEFAPDASFASRYPRAEKYVGWPMLLILALQVRPIHSHLL